MRKQTDSYFAFVVISSANVMLFFEMQTIFHVFFEKRINFIPLNKADCGKWQKFG